MMVEVNEADDDDNSTQILEYSDPNIQHKMHSLFPDIPWGYSTLPDTERDELVGSGTFI